MSPSTPARAGLSEARLPPIVAISLLEGLRAADAPRERLRDENLSESLPRRLGLSRAVDAQIGRYRDLRRQKTEVTGQEVVDLFVLVARRTDAETVFREAGTWMARQRLQKGKIRRRLSAFALPSPLRERLALRTARKAAAQVSPSGEARTERDPIALTLEGSLPAAACGSDEGCRYLAAVLQTALSAYRVHGPEGGAPEVVHPLCEARGDSVCVWRRAGGPA